MKKFVSLLVCTLSIGVASLNAVIVGNGFQDAYAPGNWTFDNGGGDGAINTSNAPNSIMLIGSDSESGSAKVTRYYFEFVGGGELSFDWAYLTNDVDKDPGYDPAGYFINSAFYQLTNNSGNVTQSGNVTELNLLPGDIFGIYINATDDSFGDARLTISNFAVIPEPRAYAAILGILALAVMIVRRRIR